MLYPVNWRLISGAELMKIEIERQVAMTKDCLSALSTVCRDYLSRSYTQAAEDVVEAFSRAPGPDALTAVRLASDFVARAITIESRSGSPASPHGLDALKSINDIILIKGRIGTIESRDGHTDFSPFTS